MNAIYLSVNKKPLRRPYCPLDADIFTPDQWDKMLEKFQQGVKEKRYDKLLYETWQKLTHDKNYAYRVVLFGCNDTNHDAVSVYITTYMFDPNDPYVFFDNGKVHRLNTNDGSLGEYLKNVYFNNNFKLAEVDVYTTDLPDTSSWEYMGPMFNHYPPPKAKLTDLPWCALYYRQPWVYKLTDKEVPYGKAIAAMEVKIRAGEIEKPDWAKPKLKMNDNPCNSAYDRVYYKSDACDKWNNFGTVNITELDRRTDTSTATSALISVDSTTAASTLIDWGGDNWNTAGSISINIPSADQVDELTKRVENIENTINKKEKEDNTMKMFNFDFGPIKDNDAIRMSPYGIAVKGVNGNYQAYDKANGEMMDVEVFNFKADNMFYKMPVAIDAVETGDVIIHNRKPMVVFGYTDQGDIIAIDIALGEKKTIMPNRNMFGFNYITKVVSLFEGFSNTQPDAQHPFGNMLPFLMMGDQSEGFDPMFMCMMMQGQNGCGNMNPMMLYFMSKAKDGDSNDVLPFLMMSMMNK